RKPGIKDALQMLAHRFAGTSKSRLRIMEPEELATLNSRQSSQDFFILVRPDLLVASADLATLRSFNAKLLHRAPAEFSAPSLGQRLGHVYQGGVSTVGAANLQHLVRQIPGTSESNRQQLLQRLGFDNVKYLVWDHPTTADGRPLSQAELSFTGPRHGVA